MDTKPILYIVAGANGSGKTTYAKNFALSRSIPFINADEIAKVVKSDFKAGRQFFDEFNARLEEGRSFAIESTLSGKTLGNEIKKAKLMGFEIHIIFLYLDTLEEHMVRVQIRVRGGGHDIPEEKIRLRFSQSKERFWNTYRKLCDWWFLLNNSRNRFEQVAYGNVKYLVVSADLFSKFRNENMVLEDSEIAGTILELYGMH